MKKLMLLVAAICALAATAFAVPSVQVYQSGYSSGSGGEFTAHLMGWSGPLQYYSDNTKNIGEHDPSFQTFCLEKGETFSSGTTYDVLFGDSAIRGDVGDAGDPISKGTAYLYHEFQNGTLDDYDYSAAGRQASAGALQDAIWYLEGEITVNPDNVFTQAVIAKFTDPMANNNGTYAVKVMTLWDQGYAGDLSHLHQDMLVCVPAPGAILLGGIGVSFVGWMRRRRTL